jgi:formylmethanofuran dehydrogenase subunit E
MTDQRCSKCHDLFPEEELLVSETTGELICPDCSGLLTGEDLGCQYIEEG